jgi:FkbM family methyltransferase
MLRSLVEKSVRSLEVRRKLPKDFGGATLYATPSAGLRYLFKPASQLDPHLLALAREFVRPGSVVWDIGANVGLFSFSAAYFSGPTGKVVAFEPDTWLVSLLRRSARVLDSASHSSVQVVPAAIASDPSLRTFCIAGRARAANFLSGYGTTQSGGAREEQTVVALSLDWALNQLPAPGVVKVDIEGAELEALLGAKVLLETYRPTLLIEVSHTTARPVTDLLHSFGYRLFDGGRPPGQRPEIELATWSTVALAR